MEANVGGHLQLLSIRIDSGMFVRRPSGSVRFLQPISVQQKLPALVSAFQHPFRLSNRCRTNSVGAPCYRENLSGLTLDTENFHPFDSDLLLKNKSQEVQPHLNGRCIYLVGMMGSGKTTIAIPWWSKKLVELRWLKFLSIMAKAISEIRRKYMQNGISIWLDVPLEALAKRIAAVGTDSRPLLHHESGNAYTKALRRLSILLEERGDAYANADAKVCLGSLAGKLGFPDVCSLTPEDIALEALVQIQYFLEQEDGYAAS